MPSALAVLEIHHQLNLLWAARLEGYLAALCIENLNPDVMMMKSAEYRA